MRRPISFLLGFTSASISLAAQIDRTEIKRTVADSSGLAIANAQAELVQDSTCVVREGTTNARGAFVISSLSVGRFMLTRRSEQDFEYGRTLRTSAFLSHSVLKRFFPLAALPQ